MVIPIVCAIGVVGCTSTPTRPDPAEVESADCGRFQMAAGDPARFAPEVDRALSGSSAIDKQRYPVLYKDLTSLQAALARANGEGDVAVTSDFDAVLSDCGLVDSATSPTT